MRRLTMRNLSSDEGLSLIETIAALVVFAIIMTGLAAGMALYAHTESLTKAKNAATSVAQQVVENARTLSVGNLAVCTGGGAPASYTYQSQSYPVVTGTTPCVQYSQTKTVNGIPFTVNEVVFTWHSTTVNNQPINEKMLVVTVSWTKPTPGSYTTSSTMTGNGTVTATTPVGLQININDNNGNLVTASNLVWDYTVTDSSNNQLFAGQTDDGTSGLLSVSPGSYTCTVTAESDAASSYSPGSNPGLTVNAATETISGACTVTANTITQWNTVWNGITSCASSGSKGTLAITVTDSSGTPVNNASVALTNVNGNGGTPAAVNTNSAGVATFNNNVPADPYTYTVSKSGYATAGPLGPVCVAIGSTASATATLSAQSTCVASSTKGTLVVTVTDESGNLVSGAKVHLTNQSGGAAPGDVNTNASGVATFNNNATAGSYAVQTSKAGYTTTGNQGPVCVVASTSTSMSALLPTSGSSGCASSSSKGTLTVTVTDSAGAPINNVNVTLTNANGHGGTPGAQKTNTSGVATFNNNVPGDLFTYVVSPPAGYTNPGTQGPICVIAGQTTQSGVVLVGIMTVNVTVTNSDVQPTKSYNVILTDSSGQATTNSMTVNANKSATVTFSNMPTDSYSVEVCVPVASTGNCDAITNNTTSYNFGTKGSTYTVTVTDQKGGA